MSKILDKLKSMFINIKDGLYVEEKKIGKKVVDTKKKVKK